MKIKVLLTLFLGLTLMLPAQVTTFYNHKWQTIAGDTISMSQFAGKKLMVVNVASYCVYTPEYTPLSQLDSIYSARYNFAVIGFPTDDFANQGGTDSVIIATCHHYNVKFQIMQKTHVIVPDTCPVYQWLERGDLNGVANQGITWNFNKFLIDRQGHWVNWYDSGIDPLDTAITNWIIEDSASAFPAGVQSVAAGQDFVGFKSANPVKTELSLEVMPVIAQQVAVNLYTIDGRFVANLYSGVITKAEEINYPVETLAGGVYLVKTEGTTFERTLKCVIQH